MQDDLPIAFVSISTVPPLICSLCYALGYWLSIIACIYCHACTCAMKTESHGKNHSNQNDPAPGHRHQTQPRGHPRARRLGGTEAAAAGHRRDAGAAEAVFPQRSRKSVGEVGNHYPIRKEDRLPPPHRVPIQPLLLRGHHSSVGLWHNLLARLERQHLHVHGSLFHSGFLLLQLL